MEGICWFFDVALLALAALLGIGFLAGVAFISIESLREAKHTRDPDGHNLAGLIGLAYLAWFVYYILTRH